MAVIAVIPARKGSKRLLGKNKKVLNGKPLICYTIEQALQCEFIDKIIVSTDDMEILEIAKEYENVEAQERPIELAQDDTPIEEVLKYVLKGYSFQDTIILLQPTSPLRTIYDISQCYHIFKERVSCTVISAIRVNPFEIKLNGAVYIFSVGSVFLTPYISRGVFMCIYFMPQERSIDIDTIEDFKEVEGFIYKNS